MLFMFYSYSHKYPHVTSVFSTPNAFGAPPLTLLVGRDLRMVVFHICGSMEVISNMGIINWLNSGLNTV